MALMPLCLMGVIVATGGMGTAEAQFSGRAQSMQAHPRPSHPVNPALDFKPSLFSSHPHPGQRPPIDRTIYNQHPPHSNSTIRHPNPGIPPIIPFPIVTTPTPPPQWPSRPPQRHWPQQPPQQPVYIPQQNRQSQQVSPIVRTVPGNTLPSNTLPLNTLPDNTVPEEEPMVQPEQNYVVNGIEPLPPGALNLTQEDADAASEILENQLEEQYSEIANQKSDLDKTLEIRKEEVSSVLSPESAAEVNAAIDARDPQALEEALKNATSPSCPEQLSELLISQVEAANSVDRLDQLIHGGGSAVEIWQASQDYLTHVQQMILDSVAYGVPMNPAAAQKVMDDLNLQMQEIISYKSAEEAIQASVQGTLDVPGGTLPIPLDSLIATWVPWLDSGATYAVGPQMVFLGTGDGGVLTSGYVSPGEAGMPIVPGELSTSAPSDEFEVATIFMNPHSSSGTISFQLNDDTETLEPGEFYQLYKSDWSLKFDRGGNFGIAEYSLEPGYYEFGVDDKGWDIRCVEREFVLDNRANAYEFNFILDGEEQSVPARDSKTITTTGAGVMHFDDGHGGAKSKLLNAGTYSIGLNRDDNQLDLFLGTSQEEKLADAGEINMEVDFAKLLPDVLVIEEDVSKLYADVPLTEEELSGIFASLEVPTDSSPERTFSLIKARPNSEPAPTPLTKEDLPVPKLLQPPKRLIARRSAS